MIPSRAVPLITITMSKHTIVDCQTWIHPLVHRGFNIYKLVRVDHYQQ